MGLEREVDLGGHIVLVKIAEARLQIGERGIGSREAANDL
jgi:hypothetical protein